MKQANSQNGLENLWVVFRVLHSLALLLKYVVSVLIKPFVIPRVVCLPPPLPRFFNFYFYRTFAYNRIAVCSASSSYSSSITSAPRLNGIDVAPSNIRCAWVHRDLRRIRRTNPRDAVFGKVALNTGSRMENAISTIIWAKKWILSIYPN